MGDELLEAWRTNNRISLFLIDRITVQGMKCTLSARGGRDVASQFAHIHNIRVWQVHERARDLGVNLKKFSAKDSPGKRELRVAFNASSKAVEKFLAAVLRGEPKRRGFKKGIFTTLSYLVAHESHHRGNILLTLKTTGNNLAKKDLYAIWGWDRM